MFTPPPSFAFVYEETSTFTLMVNIPRSSISELSTRPRTGKVIHLQSVQHLSVAQVQGV